VNLVECGPGKVLAGLNKRCAEGVTTYNLNTPDAFRRRPCGAGLNLEKLA
jgi:malonyl CoA-acyl carrier protein transacylase